MARLASLLSGAALLYATANAAPQVTKAARQEPVATAPWVTIGANGTQTITPVLTTVNGTPTVISPAPAQLTDTVFTETNYGVITTSTGEPPVPTATNTAGAGGSLLVCQNHDGPNAPFCLPTTGDTLNPGKTYYITWDATYFPAGNTTVNILATFVNTTQNAWKQLLWQAAWGFVPFPVDATMIQAGQSSSNVTLTMVVLSAGGGGGSGAATTLQGPVITIANPPGPQPGPPAKAPEGLALYIGLPVALGAVVLIVCGTCCWNRKARRIDLGNVMSRSRHGYGAGKNRTERVAAAGRGRKNKEAAIRLREREVRNLPEEQRYHDVPAAAGAGPDASRSGGGPGGRRGVDDWDMGWHEQVPGRSDRAGDDNLGLPRRDSDALGSLAGTPTHERRMDFDRPPPTGNAFRDEISRQERGHSRW